MSIISKDGLKLIQEDNHIFCDSREIAKEFVKDHDKVIRDIEREIGRFESLAFGYNYSNLFIEADYGNRGKRYKRYKLTFMGYYFLVMGYTGDKAFKNRLLIGKIMNEVRSDFPIDSYIESLIIELSSSFRTGINKDIEKIGYIYILRLPDSDPETPVKIGYTKDIVRREKELKCDYPLGEIVFLKKVYNASIVESIIHNNLLDRHIEGEIYDISMDEINLIDDHISIHYYNPLTDIIKKTVVDYRIDVEGKMNDGRYYQHYANLINSKLGIKTPKGANVRDVVDKKTLIKIEILEEQIADMVTKKTNEGIYYKEVYQKIKEELA